MVELSELSHGGRGGFHHRGRGQTASHAEPILRRDVAPHFPGGVRQRLRFHSRTTGLGIESNPIA